MTLHIWESSDFIEIKSNWQKNILRIDLFHEIAVSSEDSLDLELEAVVGLRHDIPGKGPHHLLDLLDQSSILLWGFALNLATQWRHMENGPKGCY